MTSQTTGVGMDDNEFFVKIWKLVCVAFCVLTASVSSCTAYNTYRITESKDPLAAACAIGNTSHGQACIAAAGRR
mgnify:CR=1 FL=1